MVDLDTCDAWQGERSCRKLRRCLEGVAAPYVVDVDPVADLQRVRACPLVRSAASDYFVVDEYSVHDVTATLPVVLPSLDQCCTIVVVLSSMAVRSRARRHAAIGKA